MLRNGMPSAINICQSTNTLRLFQNGHTWLTSDCRTKKTCRNNNIESRSQPLCKSPKHCILYENEYQCREGDVSPCTDKETLHCLTCTGVASMYECILKGKMLACSAADVSYVTVFSHLLSYIIMSCIVNIFNNN